MWHICSFLSIILCKYIYHKLVKRHNEISVSSLKYIHSLFINTRGNRLFNLDKKTNRIYMRTCEKEFRGKYAATLLEEEVIQW